MKESGPSLPLDDDNKETSRSVEARVVGTNKGLGGIDAQARRLNDGKRQAGA